MIEDSILRRKTARYSQIVLPAEFHETVYKELHIKMAHLGANKVIGLAQQRFYWPGMATDITNFVQKKCRCIANKRKNQIETGPMETIVTTHPLELVSIDYMHLDNLRCLLHPA